MEIKTTQGSHFKEDKVSWFKTNNSDTWEALSLRKLLLLINQIGINEFNKYRRIIDNGGELWFEESIKEVLELNKKGINLIENEEILTNFCKKWKLPMEKIKQKQIGDFEVSK